MGFDSFLQQHLPTWAFETPMGMQTWKWAALLLVIMIGLLLKRTAKFFIKFVINKTERYEKLHWQNKLLNCLERPLGLFIATAFWYIAIHGLQIKGALLNSADLALQVMLSVSFVWAAYNTMDVINEALLNWSKRTDNTLDDYLMPMLTKSSKVFVIVIGALASLQNLGVNILSLLAGLGLGGLAFALAAKDTCANLFGTFMILLDQPFKIGDWIVVEDKEGTVEDIGFRSTRIRTFYNSLISIPNATIANKNIDNMGRRAFRRVYTTLGVTYDTPPEKLEAFMEGIKNIILANPYTKKDSFHVVFSGYGASSLNVMLYFFLAVSDWAEELVERQNIYLEILRLSQDLGIDFAFPTQTLHVESFPEKKPIKETQALESSMLKDVPKEFGPDGKSSKPSGSGFFTPRYKDLRDS